MKNNKKRFRYYALNRPAGWIGHQPDGFVQHETWMPARKCPDLDNREVFGWLEYEKPLLYEQIWRFELLPAEKLTRCVYKLIAWHENDWAEIAGDYYSRFKKLDELRNYVAYHQSDRAASLVLALREAKYEFRDVKREGKRLCAP